MKASRTLIKQETPSRSKRALVSRISSSKEKVVPDRLDDRLRAKFLLSMCLPWLKFLEWYSKYLTT
jgi:hypothetical protein